MILGPDGRPTGAGIRAPKVTWLQKLAATRIQCGVTSDGEELMAALTTGASIAQAWESDGVDARAEFLAVCGRVFKDVQHSMLPPRAPLLAIVQNVAGKGEAPVEQELPAPAVAGPASAEL